ncbi:uncharacterized protein LOC129618846 [Condylostylus longicornis]|uniref:uncharacterized protein LOC129618846 n=1 Tax=Condylostylus longicornis TaxID=2530218 RepID=UPI00244E375A|nr:uncharacterized protein LOC129618846 [Condylostylus longicornis]
MKRITEANLILKKDWDYTLLSTKLENKYEENVNMHFVMTRVSRGVYAVSGNLTIAADYANEKIMISLDILRRPNNGYEYKPSPLKFPKHDFVTFFNTVYKQVFMKEFQNCSNFPVFEGEFDAKKWAKKGTFYHFENCDPGREAAYPNHMNPGVYKLIILIEGDPLVNIKITLDFSIFSKLDF